MNDEPNSGWPGTRTKYTYDKNGNMLSRAGHNETWTSYNYPSSINDGGVGEIVSFKYDADRNHWLETMQFPSGTTQTYRVGALMDLVVAGSAGTDRDYIYAGSEPVAIDARTTSGNALYYLLTDHQGSISGITNSSGQVVVDESFSAYGVRRNPATWSGWPTNSDFTTMAGITQYGYTFHRALGEKMDLIDMVGRVEDGDSGRFLSADPTIPDPLNPQSYNRYSYTENNSLTYTDPTGFCTLLRDPDCDVVITPGPPPPPRPPEDPAPLPPPDITPPPSQPGFIPLPPPPTQPSPSKPQPKQCGSGQQCTPPQKNTQQCTEAQQAAAQLAQSLDRVSDVTGWLSLGSGALTVVSGAGEGVTFGTDTPVTISFAGMTGFFGTSSFGTGALAATLNSFASGNTGALMNFDASNLINLSANAAASKVPGVRAWADTIGDLVEKATDLAVKANEACQ